MIKISVIIPVFNSEKYLAECLDSILSQTFRQIEILLVDDGSTDSSLEICREYAGKDQRVSVVHQENKGVACARKAGMKAARGEYIAFVDSDDWLEPCFFSKLYELAEGHQADLAVSACAVERGGETSVRINQFEEACYDKTELKDRIYPQMLYFEDDSFYRFGILQYLWNKLYKKSVIEPCIMNLDDRIYDGEDVACVFDACLRASSIVIDNHPYYHYRIHEESICTSKRNEKYLVNAVYLYRYMEQIFQASEEYEIMLPQLRRFISFFINNGTETMFGYSFKVSHSYHIWELPGLPTSQSGRVAIFGAGKVGQSYYRQLLQRKNIEIAAIVDNHVCGGKIGAMDIEKPEVLLIKQWDYILIAVKEMELAKEMKGWLKMHGIPDEKVIYKEPEIKYPLYELRIEE